MRVMYRLKGLAKRYNLVIWAVIICFFGRKYPLYALLPFC